MGIEFAGNKRKEKKLKRIDGGSWKSRVCYSEDSCYSNYTIKRRKAHAHPPQLKHPRAPDISSINKDFAGKEGGRVVSNETSLGMPVLLFLINLQQRSRILHTKGQEKFCGRSFCSRWRSILHDLLRNEAEVVEERGQVMGSIHVHFFS